ncbi:hypothetical protein ACHAW5_000238 [Stephanodiscus triporus]|uniref:Uncharacterized protein n=1 Tax=Stephanodiscus triporus TaxID=2934178 RepID=A0ABD3NJD6_9STRA
MVNLADLSWLGLSFVHRHVQPARRLGNTPSDDVVGVGASSPTEAGEFIDLQTPAIREAPAYALESLSRACQRLGVDAFDVYGDFGSGVERSYLRRFKAEMMYFGKGDDVFCLSGGMAQSIVLAINARKKNAQANCAGEVFGKIGGAFACHPTSHLLLHENNAFRELLGMEAVLINPNSVSFDANQSKEYDPETLKAIGCYGMEPMRLSHVKNSDITYPNRDPPISTLII